MADKGKGGDEKQHQGGSGSASGVPTMKARLYTKLGDDDVLLGRGKRSYNHEGNVRFRKLVLERSQQYKENENKSFRKAMAHEVISIVRRNGGEFLRPVESAEVDGGMTLRWETVPLNVVRTKVKQALRDMACSLSPPSSKPLASLREASASSGRLDTTMTLPSLLAAPTSSLPISALLNPSLPTAYAQLPSSLSLGQHSSHLPTSGNNIDPEYARLLQSASLQQMLFEREQTAMMLQTLDQQRSLQALQLMELQRNLNLPPSAAAAAAAAATGHTHHRASIPFFHSPSLQANHPMLLHNSLAQMQRETERTQQATAQQSLAQGRSEAGAALLHQAQFAPAYPSPEQQTYNRFSSGGGGGVEEKSSSSTVEYTDDQGQQYPVIQATTHSFVKEALGSKEREDHSSSQSSTPTS